MRILSIILLSLALCSCSTKKSVKTSDINREASVNNDIHTLFTSDAFLKYFQNQISKSTGTIKMSIYDSSQPVDPDTGKHPLSAEIEINTTTETTTDTNIEQQDKTTLEQQDNTTYKEKEDIKEEEQNSRYNIKYIISLLLIIFVLLIFVFRAL